MFLFLHKTYAVGTQKAHNEYTLQIAFEEWWTDNIFVNYWFILS